MLPVDMGREPSRDESLSHVLPVSRAPGRWRTSELLWSANYHQRRTPDVGEDRKGPVPRRGVGRGGGRTGGLGGAWGGVRGGGIKRKLARGTCGWEAAPRSPPWTRLVLASPQGIWNVPLRGYQAGPMCMPWLDGVQRASVRARTSPWDVHRFQSSRSRCAVFWAELTRILGASHSARVLKPAFRVPIVRPLDRSLLSSRAAFVVPPVNVTVVFRGMRRAGLYRSMSAGVVRPRYSEMSGPQPGCPIELRPEPPLRVLTRSGLDIVGSSTHEVVHVPPTSFSGE